MKLSSYQTQALPETPLLLAPSLLLLQARQQARQQVQQQVQQQARQQARQQVQQHSETCPRPRPL